VPSNRRSATDPRMPDLSKLKLIDYDYARYGDAAERRRLIQRWEKEVQAQAR